MQGSVSDRDADFRVEVSHLNKSYGAAKALDDVSINVARGEMVVLLGPSGCGKTTLLRSIAGLVQPDTGLIRLNGQTIFSSTQRINTAPERRKVSMVFQSYALWPHMTAAENIAYPLECQKVSTREIASQVADVLAKVGLQGYETRYPAQLSGGQQQRVALGRAIATNADVVLFDEPLSNVDARVRDHIRREIVDLQKRLGFAAVYVTHDQVEAGALADTLVVMDRGTVVQSGAPEYVYDNPDTKYVASFLGSTNELAGTVNSSDADGTRVNTPLGQIVSTHNKALTSGSSVSVLFRFDACRVHASEPAVINKRRCVVVRSTFLGHLTELTLQMIDIRETVSINAITERGAAVEGDTVWLSIAAASVWLFIE